METPHYLGGLQGHREYIDPVSQSDISLNNSKGQNLPSWAVPEGCKSPGCVLALPLSALGCQESFLAQRHVSCFPAHVETFPFPRKGLRHSIGAVVGRLFLVITLGKLIWAAHSGNPSWSDLTTGLVFTCDLSDLYNTPRTST